MDPLQLGTGFLPSPPDYRDGLAAAAAQAVAPTITLQQSLDNDFGPVLMQDHTPACVSHSLAGKMRGYWKRKTGHDVNFSPRWLDVLMKRYDGLNRETDGAYPRIGLKFMAKYGFATTTTVPNETTLPILEYRNDSVLTQAAFDEAAQYKIPGFIRVADDFYGMRAASQMYGGLSLGLFLGKEWWTGVDGVSSWAPSDLNPLRTPSKVVSGHQVLHEGWKDVTAPFDRLQNSWSAAWDDGGHADYDAKKWAPYIQEAWAIAEVPQNVADLLKTLPSTTDFHYQWNTDLHLGDHNDDVKFTQIAYMVLGYLKPIAPDELGYFGTKTAAANQAYQLAHGVTPTAPGSVGPRTRASLNKMFSL